MGNDTDVQDADRLLHYRAKRSEWIRLLDGDPVHSIAQQISAMLWNDAAYRVFNEARRYASKDAPTAAIAPMLAETLDIGYLATQVLAISKLIEREAGNPNKSVVSLRRVVDDVAANRDLFTREIYVTHDEVPYDPEPARQRHLSRVRSQRPPLAMWLPTTGVEAWSTSERRHCEFDRLSRMTKGTRLRGEKVRPEVIAVLQASFDQPVFSELLDIRHKLIAHAADANNRPSIIARTNLDRVASAHRVISQVAHVVSGTLLLSNGSSGLPTPQFDQFEHLANVFVAPEHLDRLNDFWEEHSRKRDQWLVTADAELLSGCTSQ